MDQLNHSFTNLSVGEAAFHAILRSKRETTMPDPEDPKDLRSRYNSISGTYARRYEINPLSGVEGALRDLIAEIGARRVLEIGCGTGHWLKTLATHVDWIVGLDSSSGMLRRALDLPGPIEVVCGSADSPPFAESSFDLIFVVNALHHFSDKQGFIERARHLLRPGGALATIGLDVPSAIGHWVIYDYFPETIEYDRSRFPVWEQVQSWMCEAGLAVQPLCIVEHIRYEKLGCAILDDHFIQRHGASQFMGLTDAQYQAGIDRIKRALAEAEARGEEAVFQTEMQLKMVVGRVQG
jgi:SAM-dependent methyltransferase